VGKAFRIVMGTVFVLLFTAASVTTGLAHRPVIVESGGTENDPVVVEEPEISWAYYGRLDGEPCYFRITSAEPFTLYINILVPDYEPDGEPVLSHDLSFEVLEQKSLLYRADGGLFLWKRFYEPYGRDHYYMGPEYEKDVGAGEYTVRVFSPDNEGNYSLAIGTIEKFTVFSLIDAMIKAGSLDDWFFRK